MIDKILRYLGIKNRQLPKRVNYLIIAGLAGLLLIIVSNVFSTKQSESSDQELSFTNEHKKEEETVETSSGKQEINTIVQDLEKSFEKDLKQMLEKIQGVSEVDVLVNLDSTNIQIYEKNLIRGQQTTDESDKSGGERKVEDHTEESQVVLIRQGDQEVPLLVQTKKPEVRGVFVVAKGVDHATVKMWVTESVSKVLDVPTHRVSVMPKK